jgi:hypothetical protein
MLTPAFIFERDEYVFIAFKENLKPTGRRKFEGTRAGQS